MPTYTVELKDAAAEASVAEAIEAAGDEREDRETDAELIERWLQDTVAHLHRRHIGRKARSAAVIVDPVVRP